MAAAAQLGLVEAVALSSALALVTFEEAVVASAALQALAFSLLLPLEAVVAWAEVEEVTAAEAAAELWPFWAASVAELP